MFIPSENPRCTPRFSLQQDRDHSSTHLLVRENEPWKQRSRESEADDPIKRTLGFEMPRGTGGRSYRLQNPQTPEYMTHNNASLSPRPTGLPTRSSASTQVDEEGHSRTPVDISAFMDSLDQNSLSQFKADLAFLEATLSVSPPQMDSLNLTSCEIASRFDDKRRHSLGWPSSEELDRKAQFDSLDVLELVRTYNRKLKKLETYYPFLSALGKGLCNFMKGGRMSDQQMASDNLMGALDRLAALITRHPALARIAGCINDLRNKVEDKNSQIDRSRNKHQLDVLTSPSNLFSCTPSPTSLSVQFCEQTMTSPDWHHLLYRDGLLSNSPFMC